MIRTRFSPSPTGLIHLGNARAALFSALYASKEQGQFLLRIEDTDGARSEEKYTQLLQDDLHWLGVAWQEGPGVGGPHQPYWQSQRHEIYAHYYTALEKQGSAYPCFCTEQELALNRKIQLSRGQAPRYPGTCRKLNSTEIAARLAQGMQPALRFHVPSNTKIDFLDLAKGPQHFNSDDIGDFIIRRAEGTASFMFCNAIDDSLMGVTHVLRGDDHLANTPRQLMLLQALAIRAPQYAHLSLITGEDGAPLSKRHGSFSLHDLREEGYLAHAVLNYLSRLSHTYEQQTLMSFSELATHFKLEKLSRAPARFDKNQLLHWQKEAVMALDNAATLAWLGEEITQKIPAAKRDLFADVMRKNVLFPAQAKMWSNIFFGETLQYSAAQVAILKEAQEPFFIEAQLAVKKHGIDSKNICAELNSKLNVAGKKLFMPLRVALTGEEHGPELIHITTLLGAEKCCNILPLLYSKYEDKMLKIYNSLTQQKEIFTPLQTGQVKMYVCGPTVYDYCHIGNARSFTAFDMIVRYLQYRNYTVTYVRNITDIDDKIIKRAIENQTEFMTVVTRFTTAFREDMAQLNLLTPTHEPRATEFVPAIIELIQTLLAKKYAYVSSNGDVYYDVRRFAQYGCLSHRNIDELESGARVEISNVKQDPLDFVLWKMAKPDEPAWESPWGKGRPGWHIECSAMSSKLLGMTFDLHGGGKDLIFPHHENEIAQSEAASQQKFVNYWLHAGYLQIDKEKMSKSLGNFFTVRDLLKKYSPEVLRYFLLSGHYRSPLNFTEDLLLQAHHSLTRLYTALRDLPTATPPTENQYTQQFIAAMDDDFNTPTAFSILFELAHVIQRLRANDLAAAAQHAAVLKHLGGVLGLLQTPPLEFLQGKIENVDVEKIEALIAARNHARATKNWPEADRIRQELAQLSIILEDGAEGTTWKMMASS